VTAEAQFVPRDVEDLVSSIEALSRAPGEDRDACTLWSQRLHLARNADDCVELFIEGTLESFAQTPVGRGLEFGQFRETRNAREFSALVIRSGPGGGWVRPMAHLAYEAVQAIHQDPQITNEALLLAVGPFLRLVIAKELLSTEQQVGLTGELIFLQELLNAASALGVSSRTALGRWTGWGAASRDFKGGGIAVEVKATGGPSRQHWVHPMYQLLAAASSGEKVFVCSIGLRVDRSRPYRLTTAIERILESLPGDSHEQFIELIGRYGGKGFSMSQWRQYELEPGFLVTQPPALFRVDELKEILRPESFIGGDPPARVVDMRYLLSLDGLPAISQVQREAVLRELVLEKSL
jgi:Putative  PD-(D/E)XK family member, (DUF4420)